MPKTLLLADDSVTIQRVIELTFADEDVRVVAVSDGDQAIERIDVDPPDIVLADVGMPGASGYEVAEHIKRTPALAHIPVLLLTGAFEPVDDVRARAVGCDGVLAKPFEPQLVIGRVRELLERGAAPSIAAPPVSVPAGPGASWTPSRPAGAPAVASPEPRRGEVALDHYFDRLDAAFATLGSHAPEPFPAPAPPIEPPPLEPPPAEAAPFTAAPAAEPPPLAWPRSEAAAPATTAQLPSLADAFAAILAAERGEPQPPDAPTWPAYAPFSAPSAVSTDELVEQVAHRVMDRMSDRVVRETVADSVSQVAERLVRDEIDRIKANIRSNMK